MLNSNLELIRHIYDECLFLHKSTNNTSYDKFLENEILIRAVARSLEIIGEASKKASEEFKGKHPEVSWKELSALRNIIIHNYAGVDYSIVWQIIQSEIPELEFQIKSILEEYKK